MCWILEIKIFLNQSKVLILSSRSRSSNGQCYLMVKVKVIPVWSFMSLELYLESGGAFHWTELKIVSESNVVSFYVQNYCLYKLNSPNNLFTHINFWAFRYTSTCCNDVSIPTVTPYPICTANWWVRTKYNTGVCKLIKFTTIRTLI